MKDTAADQQVAQMSWCDVSLAGFSWIEQGRDVVLHLLLPPEDTNLYLACRWARAVRITLEFGELVGGYALSWDGQVQRSRDGAWELKLDFAGSGVVYLVCQEFEILESLPSR